MAFVIQFPTTVANAADTLPDSGASSRGSHQLTTASGCDRFYAFRYIARLRPRQEPGFRLVGTLVHTALAYHYAAKLAPDRRPSWFKGLDKLEAELARQSNGQTDQLQTALEVYTYYRNVTASEPITPLFVEEEFSATVGELDPLPADVKDALAAERVTCRTDLVAMMNGKVYIIDHKCMSGGWNSDRLSRWDDDGEYKLSFQAMVNMVILAKRLPERGYPAPTGFVIQRIKRKPPFDFDRNVISLPAPALTAAPQSIRHLVTREQAIRSTVQLGQKPAPNFSLCWGRYGRCDYHAVCGAPTETDQRVIIDQNFIGPRKLRTAS